VSASSPRQALAFVAAALALGAIFWFRSRTLAPASTTPSSAPIESAQQPPPLEPAHVEPSAATAAPVASESAGEPAATPIVETKGPDPATLADVTAAVRTAIKKEARRCNPGRPITPAIANKRVVFYFTQQLLAGTVRLVDIVKIDSDLDDTRLESCILNRVADVRLSAPGAADARPRLQETIDLGDLAPTP